MKKTKSEYFKIRDKKNDIYFQGNFASDGFYILDLTWFNGLKSTRAGGLCYFKKFLQKVQVAQVAARLEGEKIPSINKSLETMFLEYSNFPNQSEVIKAEPLIDFNKRDTLERGVVAYELTSKSGAVADINADFYPAFLFDPSSTAFITETTKPIVIKVQGRPVLCFAGFRRPSYVNKE